MAISRLQNLAERSRFDIPVVDTATMYAQIRDAGYKDLLGKKALDDQTRQDLEALNQSIIKLQPQEQVATITRAGEIKKEPSRLTDEFQSIAGQLYQAQNEFYTKHQNNLSTPEAQLDYSKLRRQIGGAVSMLGDIKRSDEALKKSNEALYKFRSETNIRDIGGSAFPHNYNILNSYKRGSTNPYNYDVIMPSKAYDRNEDIKKYVGDNMIQVLKDTGLDPLQIKTVDDLIPVLQDSKVSTEVRRRTLANLNSLADNYIKTNETALYNDAAQRLMDNPIDNPNTYLDEVNNEVKNRFSEFFINDVKTDRNRSIRTLSDEQAKGTGAGMFNPLKNLSIVENPLMESNITPEVFELDTSGNIKTTYKTTEFVTERDEFGVTEKRPKEITKSVTIKSPDEYSRLLYNDDKFREVLTAEGVNIVGDVKESDIPRIQKALKDNRDRVYKNMQIATNGYDAVQLNTPKLDQTLSNQINASTLRFNKDQTLPEDLPQRDTQTKSLDGSTFNNWLSSKVGVKIQTDNILSGTGQLGKPLGFKRTVSYQDEKGGPVKKLDIYQDSPFKDVNDNPAYNALNEISKYTSSGKDASQIKVPTENGQYVFELKRIPNNSKMTYDYSGRVFDPTTRTWSKFEDFKKAATVASILDVLKNSEGIGRSFTKDDIGQIEAMYENQNNEE